MASSLDLSYMKLVRFTFSLIDCWPHRDMKSKKPIPLANNKFLFCEFRLTLPWTKAYRQLIIDFVENIHIFHYKGDSDYSKKMHYKIHKVSTYFTIFLHVQMYSGIILFNITPLHNNIKAGLFKEKVSPNDTIAIELSLYYDLPFDCQENLKAYFAVFIFNFFVSFVNTFTMCINELFISLIAIHLWGHFKILQYNLINFPRPKEIKLNISYDEESTITNLLIKYMKQHRVATDFLSKTVNVFGPTMCLYYLFQQISECIVLCEICKLDAEALGKYGILTLVIFQQLIQISIVYEIMSSMNEKIINAVYGLPWEHMSVRNQKIVLFFLQNVQVPFNLRALDMVPIGAQTMVVIIRTSFSYFIMLRTIAYD
ncbi:PREDICTED: uncharacterized protein LOC106119290 [Papilio xuthus]|uniref:Odorant receptor n=1 Tax=Papilio xuthus TaxID=66420 RepID=A0AAJ6ZCF7_PAPXU|nr:PREDICTED: uncharacterized protein LOC106119290 [Papilio xuthus]